MKDQTQMQLMWVPMYALFKREVRRFIRVIYQTIATPLITTALYLLIFGVSIGNEIKDIHNTPYLAFLIPGLIMMSTLRNTFDNSSGTIVTSKFCGELEDLRIVPMVPSQITWANGGGALVRGLIVGFITYLIGSIFYFFAFSEILTIQHPILCLIFLVTGGLAFAHLGLTVSMISSNFEQVSAINTFVLLPLIYLGGVFFSLEQLHPFWQIISKFNPLLYFVNGLRYAILGISDVDVTVSLIVAFITLIIFHILSLWSLHKGSYHRW